MALSLNKVSNTNRERPRKTKTKSQVQKPWQQQTPSKSSKASGKTAKSKIQSLEESLLEEVIFEDSPSPWIKSTNNDFEEKVDSVVEKVSELQKHSYALTKVSHLVKWVGSIEITPKVRIPVPRWMHQHD